MPFYVTNATHFLDEKGAIGPTEGPALAMSEFFGSVIVLATFAGTPQAGANCIQCGEPVVAKVGKSDEVEWKCSACDCDGRISHWRLTLWDMSPKW